MSFNLVSKLTKEDRVKIKNYITLYGTKNNFIGIDEWLKYWGTCKIKPYKLLGNQFIYKFPFEYNKPQEELWRQLKDLVNTSPFIDKFFDWLEKKRNEEYKTVETEEEEYWRRTYNYFACKCLNPNYLELDKTGGSIEFQREGIVKKLRLQEGMKPIRAASRFLNYCKDMKGVDELIALFEDFRIAHSMVLNDKKVKGNLCISIHPLDFMTMSDNNSNWHSCMAWSYPENGGCYHEGTVEMMNSNNVLCCYLESAVPYYFSKNEEIKTDDYLWNNKKWRQLVYITKDIIVTGKPYPYSNEEFSKALIQKIRELAKENLGWTYTFGPELYRDMIHINGSYSMDRAKTYIRTKNMCKHNILFDTKGMYNDMLNDSNTKYWCVRNKVEHNKVISYSGKAPCLCCGEPVIKETDYWDDLSDYNDRYQNTGEVICEECLSAHRCNYCGVNSALEDHVTLYNQAGEAIRFCEKCYNTYFRKCPDCGRAFYISTWHSHYSGGDGIVSDEAAHIDQFIRLKENYDEEETLTPIYHRYFDWNYRRREAEDIPFETIFPVCRCNECASKDTRFMRKVFEKKGPYSWNDLTKYYSISCEVENSENWTKYAPENLEKAPFPADGEVIIC